MNVEAPDPPSPVEKVDGMSGVASGKAVEEGGVKSSSGGVKSSSGGGKSSSGGVKHPFVAEPLVLTTSANRDVPGLIIRPVSFDSSHESLTDRDDMLFKMLLGVGTLMFMLVFLWKKAKRKGGKLRSGGSAGR